MSLQERIDELAYPPTHTYRLEGLAPTGVLEQRLKIITRMAPTFFTSGIRFLDVGCNKGWFSLSHINIPFKYIVGIDYNDESIHLCKEVQQSLGLHRGLHFFNTTFRNFTPLYKFDRVMIGNVHHYLYKDTGGWEWIPKLSALMTNGGFVLIEGPKDMSCSDMDNFFDDTKLEIAFTNLPERMARYGLKLIKSELAVTYTPGRCVWLFKKSVPRNNIPLPTRPGLVVKYINFETLDQIRVELGSYAPYSNPIDGWVKRENNVYGWTEKEIVDLRTYKYRENEKELFNAFCDRNVFLAKNGFIDLDGGTLNFGLSGGRLVHFDKGAIHPISSLNKTHWDYNNGVCMVVLRQSYDSIQEDIYERISIALSTKDSKTIENCFREVKM